MENLKLEVGKFYRTRNGQKVECVFCKPEGLGTRTVFQCIVLFEGGQHVSYMQNGNHWAGDSQISLHDIISEWEETPEELFKRIGFEPTCLPTWGIWIAQDEDREWGYYDNEPSLDDLYFFVESGVSGTIPNEYAPKNYTGDWKDSKFKVK